MEHSAAEGRMSGIYPNYSGSGIAGWSNGYLTIIPRARMGSESIAHEAVGRMGYWLSGHEGESLNQSERTEALLVNPISQYIYESIRKKEINK